MNELPALTENDAARMLGERDILIERLRRRIEHLERQQEAVAEAKKEDAE